MKVILVGAGGSGKDHLGEYLKNNGFKKNVAYTTRPKRANEKHGEDYFFIDADDFEQKIKENYWHEYNVFIPSKKWYYGSSYEQFEACDLFIKEANGVSRLSKKERKRCVVVFINIDENIRRERMSSRVSNADDVERRLLADRIDFEKFTDFDIMVTDPNFDCRNVGKLIVSEMTARYNEYVYYS